MDYANIIEELKAKVEELEKKVEEISEVLEIEDDEDQDRQRHEALSRELQDRHSTTQRQENKPCLQYFRRQ